MDWYARSNRNSISSGSNSNAYGSPNGNYNTASVPGSGGSNSGGLGGGDSTTPTLTPTSYTNPQQQKRSQFYSNYHPLLPPSSSYGGMNNVNVSPTNLANTNNNSNVYNNNNNYNTGYITDRSLYYFSQLPLYCADWTYLNGADMDCVALSTYKEGFKNKIQIIHGVAYGTDGINMPNNKNHKSNNNNNSNNSGILTDDIIEGSPTSENGKSTVEGFDFHKVSEISVDYPVTALQWDPSMIKMNNGFNEKLAASSDVLRLYKVDHDRIDNNNDYKLVQTHILANNSSSGNSSKTSSGGSNHSPNLNKNGSGTNSEMNLPDDVNKFPPVTSFDWNKIDLNIIITSSVDTTCTVWDLNRSYAINGSNKSTISTPPTIGGGATTPTPTTTTTTPIIDTAQVKTQLIAHDSEVFDVKFINNSTNIFASVGNDGSMRVFDLRSLEHSTIIYEPTMINTSTTIIPGGGQYNSNALIKLSTSNIDARYLATIGVNSNQVIIIDMRMPGIPVLTLDGSLGGINNAAINSIQWHPTSNHLLTGGDDCQALIWDCNHLTVKLANKSDAGTNIGGSNGKVKSGEIGITIDTPLLSYEEDLEVNNVCWRSDQGDWMGVISGKGFQAVQL